MDPSNSSIQHEVKVKKEPVDEDEETRLDHNLSHLTNGWFEFRCNSGEVLFYFNIFSNEHRWMGNKCTCSKETLEEISSQSIGIQCDIDSKPKEIPSQDVSIETDFSFLGEQKARIAVSVQTEVSVIPDKSFRDEDLSKDSILPLEFVLPTIDPSTLENDGYFKPLCANVHDSEQIARAPESSLDSTPITEEQCDNNKEEVTEEPEEITNNPSLTLGRAEMQNEQSDESKEFLNEGKSNDLSAELNDGQFLKKQHSLNKNSLDCETSPEENSSDLSYEPADEYGESVRDIVDETSCSNNISSQEQNLNRDQSITSVSSNDEIREVAASEEKFLLETEKNCEENVVSSLADICHSVLKRHFSGVNSHSDCNPSTDEACEKETENDSCPSDVKTSREENLNTSALSSFNGELPSDSCSKSDNNTKGREESKETRHQESEQSATLISCKKVKPQTARKCANSLRKCLMVQEKVSRSSNIGNSSKITKWNLRKRSFRNKTCTNPFSKRLNILLTPLEQDLPCIGRQLKSTFNKGTGSNTVDNITHNVKHDHSYFSSEDDGRSRSEQVSESDVHSRQNSNENTIRDTIPNPQTISIENRHGPGSEPSVTTAGIARNVCLYLTESNQVVMHIVSTDVAVSSEKYSEDHPQTAKELKDVSECVVHSGTNISPKEIDLNANQPVQSSPEKRKTRRKRKGHIKVYPAKNQRKRKTPVQRSVNCGSFVHTPFTEGSGLMGEERQIDKDEVKENHFVPSNNRENAESSSRELSMDGNHGILEGNEFVEHFILNENPDDLNQENISKDLLFGVGDEVSNEHLVVEKNNEDVGEIREVGGEIELQIHPSNKDDGSGDQPLVDGDLRDENQVVENSNEDRIQGALKEIEPRSHSTNKDSSPGDHPLLDEESQDVSQVVENSDEDRIQGALKEIEPRSHSTNKDSSPGDHPLLDEESQDVSQVIENSDEDRIQGALKEIEPRSHSTNKDSSPGDHPLLDEESQDVSQVVENSDEDRIQGALKEIEPRSHSTNKDSSPGDHPLLDEESQDVSQVVENSDEDRIQGALKEIEPRSHSTNEGSCPEDEPLVDEESQDANQVVENSNEDEIQEALNEIEPRSHATNKDSSPEDQPLVNGDLQDKNHVLETPKEDCIQRHENEKGRYCNPCSKGSSSGHQLLTDADCKTIPVVEKSYKEEFREEGHNYEPKDRPTFQDDRQEDMDDKELHVKEKKGPDGNDDNDTQGKAKENIQDFQYRLESLHKFAQNQNECKDICVDKGAETQNKSMVTNRHLEDQLQDLSMMQENEDAYAVGNDAQSKPKEKTEKLEENHEQSPILNKEHQRGIEIEIERENGVKSDEKESESKTDENQEKIGRECQEHGDRVAGCILEDGNSGIPDETKEMEIVGSDETRAEYESQKQEKSQDPEQKLPDVEASGQITKETEPISQGCQSDDTSADIIPIHLDSKLTPTPDKDAENNPRNSVGYSKPSRQYRRRVDLGCKFCDKRFKSSFKLSCHLRGHKVQKLKTCKICLRTFRSLSLLCEHLKYHNTTSKYSCSYCNEGFISHQKLVSHFIKCNETKSSSKKTSNGNNTTRDEVSLAAPLLKNGSQLDVVSRSNLTCNICNVIYAYPKSFRKHLKLHSVLPNGTAAENALRESYKALDNYTNNENCKARSLPGDETVSNNGVSESQTITSSVDSDKNAKPFSCSICGMHFVKAYWFDRHMQYKHGISPGENPAGAEDAASPSEDVDEDSETLSVVSDDNTDGNTVNSFECSICGMAYTKAFWLTRHMQNKHGVSMEDSSVTKDETSSSDVVDKADGNPLDCSVCGMHFKLECWLNRHKEKKHGISAEEVPTVAPSPEAKKDELTDTGESHPQLKNVVKIVSGEGPLKCYRCGIVFKKEYWYKRHVKIKHGMFVEIVPPPSPAQTPEPENDKRNGTEKASKSSNESQKNHPQMQERTENMTEKEKNERQMYKCKVCDREFVHLGHLENHSKHHGFVNKNSTKETGTSPRNVVPEKPPLEVRTNTGNDRNSFLGTEVRSNDDNVVIGYKQNNFKCSECPEEFAHLDDLIKHSSRTHAPGKCPHCEVRCSTSEELQSHLQIHRNDASTDGVKKISCKICGKEVSTAVELITHFRTHKRGSRKRKVSKTQEKEKESPPSEEQSSSKSIEPTGSKSSDVPNSQTGKEASTVQDPKKTLSESVVPKSPKSTEPIRNPKKQRNLRVSVFFCYLCNKAFHNVGKRLLHMKRSHPDGNRYVCSTCGRGFQESHLYNLHKLEHRDMNSTESQAVSSTECSRIPESSRNDARSIQTVPIIRADQHFRYRCSDCGRGFQREHFYNMHKLKLHSATSTEKQADRIEISNSNDNSVNTEMSHNDVDCLPKEIDFPKNNSTADIGSQSTARPVSFNAGVSTKQQLALRRKYLKCSICSRKFFKKKNLRRHEREHGDNMQSIKIPCISQGSSTCQPTDRLSTTVINTSAAQESTSLALRDNETAISKNGQSQNSPGRLEEMPRQERILEFPYTETSCKGESDVFQSASSKASLTNESQNDSTDTICQDKNDAATESAYVCNKGISSIENSMTNESEDDIIDVVGDNSSGFVTESSSVCNNETPSTAGLTNEIQNITIGPVNEDKYGSALESTILCKGDPSNEINLTKESRNVTHSPSRSVFQYLNLETQSCATLAGEKYKCSYCTLSFTSFYQRNSHVCMAHKMRLKQALQHEGPGLLQTANQAARPQASTQVSFHITQDESELSKSLDNKEFINSSAKENGHNNRKRKHDPNIIRRSKIGRHFLYGDDLDDQDGSILSETMIRNDSSSIESLEEESSFIFDFI